MRTVVRQGFRWVNFQPAGWVNFTPALTPIVDEVERPPLVRSQGNAFHGTTAQCELAPHALTHLKAGSAVDPADALMVIADAITAK